MFEGDHLSMTCSIDSYSRERIAIEDIEFSVYNNHGLLAKEKTYTTVAKASRNGNYTCKAKVTQGTMFVKESATLVVKAKGECSS